MPITSKTSAEDSYCPLLHRLCYDIRLLIYRELLTGGPEHIYVQSANCILFPAKHRVRTRRAHYGGSKFEPAGLSPAILSTCRTVYDEAIPVLYRDNKFILNDALASSSWLKALPDYGIATLRSLTVYITLAKATSLPSPDAQVCRLDAHQPGYSRVVMWIDVFQRLAKSAWGLRNLVLALDRQGWDRDHWIQPTNIRPSNPEACIWQTQIINAITDIKTLRSFEMIRSYPAGIPKYLSLRMGVKVATDPAMSRPVEWFSPELLLTLRDMVDVFSLTCEGSEETCDEWDGSLAMLRKNKVNRLAILKRIHEQIKGTVSFVEEFEDLGIWYSDDE